MGYLVTCEYDDMLPECPFGEICTDIKGSGIFPTLL